MNDAAMAYGERCSVGGRGQSGSWAVCLSAAVAHYRYAVVFYSTPEAGAEDGAADVTSGGCAGCG